MTNTQTSFESISVLIMCCQMKSRRALMLFNNVRLRTKRGLYAVKVRCHTPLSHVRCHGSHECWFTHSQFHSQFHLRWHSLRITLKYTTLVHMHSGYAWTMKSWQWSEWRLGFNSVLLYKVYGDSILFVLNGTALTPFWLLADDMVIRNVV